MKSTQVALQAGVSGPTGRRDPRRSRPRGGTRDAVRRLAARSRIPRLYI